MQAVIAILAALVRRARTGEGAYLDVSVADGVLALMSLYVDEYLATGAVPGPRPQHPHRPLRLLRRLPRAPTASGSRSARSSRTSTRNLCRALGCEQWIAHQTDDAVQDEIRADFRAAFATRPRDEWVAELGPADTCVSAVATVPELVDDAHLRARGVFVDGDARDRRADFDQVGSVLAGHRHRAERRSTVRDAHASPTPTTLLARRGLHRRRDRGAATRKEWSHDASIDDLPADVADADRRGAVRGDRRVPRRARLHLDDAARRSRTATRSSGTTPSPPRSPAARSRRRRCSRCGSGRTTGRPAATEQALPLQVHFDLKERFGLPEAVMTDNTIVFHEPVRPGDLLRTRQILRSVSGPEDDEARHRPLLGDRRRVPQPARRARRRRVLHRLRLPAGATS